MPTFFIWTLTRSGRLAEIRWSLCISTSQRSSYFSFSGTDSVLCIYYFVVLSSADSSTYMQNHDTINKKTQEDFFMKIYLSIYLWGFEKVVWGFTVGLSCRPNINCKILTPTLMAVNAVSFSFSRCSTGGPAAQLSAKWWLSLLHLISIFSGLQTPSGFPSAPSAGCGFPYIISSITLSDL